MNLMVIRKALRSKRQRSAVGGAVVLGAVGGAVAGYTQAGLIGGVGGSIGGMLTLFAGVVWPLAVQQSHDEKAASKAWDRVLTRIPATLQAGPVDSGATLSELLLADRQIVPIVWGRRSELSRLQSWISNPAIPLAVLVGPPLVGKTRLSLALAGALPDGWVAGRLRAGSADVIDAVEAVDHSTLIVVESPGWRPELPRLLEDTDRLRDGKAKVLLITRQSAWLDYLSSKMAPEFRKIVHSADIMTIESFGGSADLQRWYMDAAGYFAARLGRSGPRSPNKVVGPAPPSPIGLVLARSLLYAITNDQAGASADAEAVAEALAEHESAQWPQPPETNLSVELQTRVVAALILIGTGDDLAEACGILRRVPELHRAADERIREIASWALPIYRQSMWAWPLAPSLIAQAMVIPVIRDDARLRVALTANLDPPRLARSISFLLHSTETYSIAAEFVDEILRATEIRLNLGDLLETATGVPPTHAVDQILEGLVRDERYTSDVLEHRSLITDPANLPRTYVALHRADVDIARASPSGRHLGHDCGLATALSELAEALSFVDLPDEAIAVHQEAMTLWRAAAADVPEDHNPHLAQALSSLGRDLKDAGRPREALPLNRESVDLYRKIQRDGLDAQLARALINLAVALKAVGQPHEGIPMLREAVAIGQQMTDADPSRGSELLAPAVGTLGKFLTQVGEPDQALMLHQEVNVTFRSLAANDPAFHKANLSISLSDQGHALSLLGRHREAYVVHQESVALMRELVGQDPTRYAADLIAPLTGLANCLSLIQRPREAVAFELEMVTILRKLVAQNASAHTPGLAMVLGNLGQTMGAVGRNGDARVAFNESISLLKKLESGNPGMHAGLLAHTLTNLGVFLARLGQTDEAVRILEEAVALLGGDPAADPAQSAQLADTLGNLAAALSASGQHAQAIDRRQQAFAHWGRLVAAKPSAYGAKHAKARSSLREALAAVGRGDENIIKDLL